LINAVNKNEIHLNSESEKLKIMSDLRSSLEILNASPKIKISHHNLINQNASKSTNSQQIDEVMFGRGKKHFSQHPNRIDNVAFDYKDYYFSPNERIDQLINYYSKIGKQDRDYQYNPELYSFYKKERIDPIDKWSRKVRRTDISPDNPVYKDESKNGNKMEEYVVMKFSNKINSENAASNLVRELLQNSHNSSSIKNNAQSIIGKGNRKRNKSPKGINRNLSPKIMSNNKQIKRENSHRNIASKW
jgi:hypothetical protein